MLYRLFIYCVSVRAIQTYVDPIAFDIKFGGMMPIVAYVIIWFVCRIAYGIVKKIIWFLTLPFGWISFGLLGLIINILLVYGVQYAVNHSGTGLMLLSPDIIQVLWFAWAMTVLSLILDILP